MVGILEEIIKPFRILVCGGRDYDDKDNLFRTMNLIKKSMKRPIHIINGGARGADFLSSEWARHWELEYDVYYADWATYEKAAGPIRNKLMLEEGKPHVVVAFGGGRGTNHMCSIAKKSGIPVQRFK